MKRLKKSAIDEQINEQINTSENLPEETNQDSIIQNNTVVIDLLQRIDSNAEDIKSSYYSLLENLNALNKDFSGVYNELKVMVKLPNKNDINSISTFKDDMDKAIQMLSDETFLNGLVK